ncbi:hypothetical protein BDY19DRAFT_910715 [Irpex rosettiformis]|uniref:Uncharacterized protein n=1 Tax=Irpex rosettiformis TaxID=378272 RepID=A0ACB8TMU9_9APHY|nr:hypothetical protein BDY19DRAFT_910715 [Irpex rosettiformis]
MTENMTPDRSHICINLSRGGIEMMAQIVAFEVRPPPQISPATRLVARAITTYGKTVSVCLVTPGAPRLGIVLSADWQSSVHTAYGTSHEWFNSPISTMRDDFCETVAFLRYFEHHYSRSSKDINFTTMISCLYHYLCVISGRVDAETFATHQSAGHSNICRPAAGIQEVRCPYPHPSVILKRVLFVLPTASALVVSLWDTLATLDQEVDCIWTLPFGAVKALFFFVRYGNVAALLYVNYIYSGINHPTTDAQCKAFQATYDSLIVLNSCFYNAFVALRVYAIWDRRRKVKIILCVVLAIVQVPVFVLGGKSVAAFASHTVFTPAPINTCVTFQENNLVKVAFGCVLLYDVFVILLAVFNVFDRPRRPQHKVVMDLHRDGAIWFFVLFFMRLTNFLFFLLLPATKVFCVIFLTWALISITLARMIMRIESTKRPFVRGGTRKVQVRTWVPERDMFELEHWGNGTTTSAGTHQ